jgi:hypothetical protein
MSVPIDTTSGLQAGCEPKGGTDYVLKGWLVTLPDGHETRLGPDETRARNYALQQRAIAVEPLFVHRHGAPGRMQGAGEGARWPVARLLAGGG